MTSGLRSITSEDIIAFTISSGVANVVVNQIFDGPQKSRLKVGDVVMFKGGKLVSVAREGIIYDATTILGPIGNTGRPGAGSEDGYAEGSVLRGGRVIRVPIIPYSYCYRTFSNGQIIQVPCP